jgi:hypothetical protein
MVVVKKMTPYLALVAPAWRGWRLEEFEHTPVITDAVLKLTGD